MIPDNTDLPDWVTWLAQDADGVWWGYQVEPLQYHRGWYENEIGRCIRVGRGEPGSQWADTLRKVR
jgi:hypothetical protein